MTEFTLAPPAAILLIAGGVAVLAVISTFLKKGEWPRKIVALVIVAVVITALLIVTYRPTTITVSETGIRLSGSGRTEFLWDDVNSAVFEPALVTSEYRPTVRTRGVAIGDYRRGRFLLSNGDPAQVHMERADSAVIVQTDELTYLFAPEDVERLAAAIDEYRTYSE